MRVTWDENKRKQVIKDHGVDLAKVQDVLDDPHAIDFSDADHSSEDPRRVIVGKTVVYGLVAVFFTVRGDDPRFYNSPAS